MKISIVIVKSDKDGKLIITEQELSNMLEKVYETGFEDGKKEASE